MASNGYYYYYSSPYHYHQPAPCYDVYSPQQRARSGCQWSSVPVVLLLATASLLVATAVIAWCGSAVESLLHQLRGFLVLSPVLVVIAVQLWVASGGGGGGGGLVSLLAELVTGDQTAPAAEQYYPHRYRGGGAAGSSPPWGVALAMVLVLFLVSYQSSIHWRWFGR